MEVKYKPSFIKDFNKIKSRKEQEEIYKICFKDILEVTNLSEIRNLKKIKGYNHYYRIRKGDFRIGVKYDGGQIVFMRVLKRANIYKYFP
jgi:mRNA-degrading endonuclease RelE of RelBE toxin-antitoxin system